VPKPGTWPQYPPDGAIKDGSTKPAPPRSPDGTLPGPITSGSGTTVGAPSLAGSPGEQQLIDLLTAPALGVAPADVPNWSSLLVGPLYRGAEVDLK
jgi:hypothetical protein